MAKTTKIEWCDSTFNPVVGCTKVSPACDHCYAETWAKRAGNPQLWTGDRRKTGAAVWRAPHRWQKEAPAFAAQHGRRRRVFCASLSDVFDNQWKDEWRYALWCLIALCPDLDFLLLTKRPQNIAKMLPRAGHDIMAHSPWPWPHVWLGTTVENQEEADRRIPHLLATPAAVRFLSCEPLLGPVDLSGGLNIMVDSVDFPGYPAWTRGVLPSLDWVIAGGESGPGKRPMDLAWMRSLRDQCAATGTAFFGKQDDKVRPLPPDLMVREFPAHA